MRLKSLTLKAAPLAMLALLALPGCVHIKYNAGYVVDESLVAAIQPGVDNKASVERTLGRPTYTAQFDVNEWYYVSRNSEQTAYFAPKPVNQSVLIIRFDARGNVTKVDRTGLEKVANVGMNKDKTPTLGRDTGILDDLFGNIGQFGGTGATGPTGAGSGRDGPR